MKTHIENHVASKTCLGYARFGQGAAHVLVLHDWLGDHSNYEAAIPWFDGDTFTYVFADLRGYGLSIDQTGTYTVAEAAADCLKLVDQLGWQRFHVVSHSMTGMITQRLAADAPSRILSAAGNRLSPETFAFFASTANDDFALRRLFMFVSSSLSEQWAEHKLQCNRLNVAPACRLKYLDAGQREFRQRRAGIGNALSGPAWR